MSQSSLQEFGTPEFDRLSMSLSVLLFHRPAGFKLGEEQINGRVFVAGECYGYPLHARDDCPVRSLFIRESHRHNWQEFKPIAETAGQCLGDWSLKFGVTRETLLCKDPDTRWLYSLFDLAWAGRIPVQAKKGAIDIGRWALVHVAKVNGEVEPKEADQQLNAILNEAFNCEIANVVPASRYACEVLKRKPPKGKRKKRGPKVDATKQEIQSDCYNAWQTYTTQLEDNGRRAFADEEFLKWCEDNASLPEELTASGIKGLHDSEKQRLKRNSTDNSTATP